MRKLFAVLVGLTVSLNVFAGCQWAGRTAGRIEKGAETATDKTEAATEEAARRIERLERDFQKGYEAGRK